MAKAKELSIFIDESGDFGPYEVHSPYYFITLVFHDQSNNIAPQIQQLDGHLDNLGLPSHYIHTAPLIRKEGEYYNMSLDQRRRIMARMLQFSRNVDVKYKFFCVKKRETKDEIQLIGKLSEQISNFIKDNLEYFCSYDIVKIYYDNGQAEVTKILSSVFNSFLSNVEFRSALSRSYKLSQLADFYCTFELIKIKRSASALSRSEKSFFKTERLLEKNYLKVIARKAF